MKKIMIIGAGLLQMYVIKRAKELGYITVVVDRDEDAVGYKYADYHKAINIIDKEACLEYAKEMQIDGVITAATEYGVITASYIAKEMNLKGLDIEVAKLIKNKYEVRKRLFEEKIDDNPQHYIISSIDDINDIQDEIIYPIMVKPCDGSGSKGVNKVENLEELKSACEFAINNSLSKKVLLETFIIGKEYGVESFVYNSEPTVLGIMEKVMTKPPYYAELGHTIGHNLDKELDDKIRNMVKRAIRALGINFGAVNMDLLVTDKNEVCIVDVGGRMGGNLIGSHIIPLATGIDHMGNIIKGAVGDPIDVTPKFSNVVSTRIMNFKPGTVKELPSLDEYINDTEVKDIVLKLNVGDKINYYKNNLDGCGYIVVSANDVTAAKNKALKIKCEIDEGIIRIEES